MCANPVFVCGHAFPRGKLNLNFPFIKRKQQVSVVMRGLVLCSSEASASKPKLKYVVFYDFQTMLVFFN